MDAVSTIPRFPHYAVEVFFRFRYLPNIEERNDLRYPGLLECEAGVFYCAWGDPRPKPSLNGRV